MSPSPNERCERIWELGAARNGRLRDSDLDSLRRHLQTCGVCSREQNRLEAVGDALRDLPLVADDALAARRMRHRLLKDVDRLMVEPPAKRSRARRFASAGMVAASLVLGAAVGYRALHRGLRNSAPAPIATTIASPPVEISATDGAHWRKLRVGNDLVVELNDGELSAKIGEHLPSQRVRIELPDGWIEDLGTVLSVNVEGRRTLHVKVNQGRVLLRLRQHEAIELRAGDSWSAPPEPAASAAMQPVASTTTRPSHRIKAASAASALSSKTATSSANPETDSMGDARAARAEDEAYLHIVVLLGAHQADAARAAAKAYLMRFPNGFRREEVIGVVAQ